MAASMHSGVVTHGNIAAMNSAWHGGWGHAGFVGHGCCWGGGWGWGWGWGVGFGWGWGWGGYPFWAWPPYWYSPWLYYGSPAYIYPNPW